MAEPGPELQVTGPDDWELWRGVRLRALGESPEAFCSVLADWAEADETAWRNRLAIAGLHLVALLDGHPVGQVSGVPTDHPEQVELISLWVADEARGHGLGSALVEAVAQWGRDTGSQVLRLDVMTDNEAAIGLYERVGFTLDDTRPAEDKYSYSLHLAGG